MPTRRNSPCTACGQKHKKPVNELCPYVSVDAVDDRSSDLPCGQRSNEALSDVGSSVSSVSKDLGLKLLEKFESMEAKILSIDSKVNENAAKLAQTTQPTLTTEQWRSTGARPRVTEASTSTSDGSVHQPPQSDAVIPNMRALQTPYIESQVNQRMGDTQYSNDSSGKLFKSQRGGKETVWVKRCIPWPQNFILGGPDNSRMSFDQLNAFQFVSGFALQIREEKCITTKDCMLEYFAALFEDANDFSWSSAKSCHASVCCKMEDAKFDWLSTHDLDRCRRSYAQRAPSSKVENVQNVKSDKKIVACKFYQRNRCFQHGDHDKDDITYKHICLPCFQKGKMLRHRMTECPDRSKN